MALLNTISGLGGAISVGGSSLSLISMGAALFTRKSLQPGISGFLFDIRQTENLSYSAQITDHYAEDNTSIQDHIALNPMTITLVGKIGELVYKETAGLAFLRAMADRLGAIGALSPGMGVKAQQAIAAAAVASSAIDSISTVVTDLKSVMSGRPSLNKQQKALSEIEGFFLLRSLLTVETPWGTYEDMAIESFSVDQDDTTLMETTFTITFKEMAFVEIDNIAGSGVAARIEEQKAKAVNKGMQRGTEETLLYKALN